MKLLFVLGLLLPLGAMAIPAANPEPIGTLEQRSAAPEPAENLVKRSQYCSINGKDGDVACREGPGTSYTRTSTAYAGNTYLFSCYKKGQCVSGNWYVLTGT